MLTLDTEVRIPEYASFGFIEEEVVLLNTRTNQYFHLKDVGSRLWELLKEGKNLRETYAVLLSEYVVDSVRLERDILELVDDLEKHGLLVINAG